jgi:hypothetical protein
MRAAIPGAILLGSVACGAGTDLGWPTAGGGRGAHDASFGGAASGSAAFAGAGRTGEYPLASTACTDTSECMLAVRSCCVGCGVGTVADAVAVNRGFASSVYQSLCPGAAPCPSASACDPPSTTVVALCRDRQCESVDIRTDALTACSSATDCQLRWGVSCCEGCGSGDPSGLVAVNGNAFARGVCGSAPTACPACAPTYPVGWVTRCETGRCVKGRIL